MADVAYELRLASLLREELVDVVQDEVAHLLRRSVDLEVLDDRRRELLGVELLRALAAALVAANVALALALAGFARRRVLVRVVDRHA